MNPYAVLGVPSNASDQEIKSAYRRLVKRYHPDRQSPEASHEQIAAINHAYDILSDPARRAQYDRGFTQIFIEQPEDPVEVYKREFKRKRRAQEQKERERQHAWRDKVYRVSRWIHMPIFLFATVLVLNDLIVNRTFTFFYLVLLYCSGYISYHRARTDLAYKLTFWSFLLFIIILLTVL